MPHFFYTRKQEVTKKDSAGNPIPLMEQIANIDPAKPPYQQQVGYETEEKILTDSFNLNKVIRVHMISEDKVLVLLDDGHEVTEKVPALRNPNKPAVGNNVVEERKRSWLQSEIIVEGEEVKNLYDALAAC